MATLKIEGSELVTSMSAFEKFQAIHSEVRVPLSSVTGVEVLDDALSVVRGIRSPGTGIPGVMMIGTMRYAGKRSFVVIHRGHPRGLRVTLNGQKFDALLVGCQEPERVAKTLKAALETGS